MKITKPLSVPRVISSFAPIQLRIRSRHRHNSMKYVKMFKKCSRCLNRIPAPNLVPRVYSASRWRLRAEKTLAHTVRLPAKYSTNREVFCHVTHNRISSSLHLISGSRIQKWLKMSEDLASMRLHFACFSCKIVFCGP